MRSFEGANTIAEQHNALEGIILIAALTARVGSKNLGGIQQAGHTAKYAPEIGKTGLRHSLVESTDERAIVPNGLKSTLRLSAINLPREANGKLSATAIKYEMNNDGVLSGVTLSDSRLPERPMYWADDPLSINPIFSGLGLYVKMIIHTSFAVLPHHAYMYAEHPAISPVPYDPRELAMHTPRRGR